MTEAQTESQTGSRGLQKAAARARVLDAAARTIREQGVDGVSVAAIMKRAGLTHGGFYAHFASKEDLVAQAIHHAADLYREEMRATAERGGVGAMAEAYLSPDHAGDPGSGCFIAALGPEVARQDGTASEVLADRVDAVIGMIEGVLGARGLDSAQARPQAIAALATVVGGMVLARTGKDPERRDAILAACRATLTDMEGEA